MCRLFFSFFIFVSGTLLPAISMAQLSTETFSQNLTVSANTLNDRQLPATGVSIPKFDSRKGILREMKIKTELISGSFTVTGFQLTTIANNIIPTLSISFAGSTDPHCGFTSLGFGTTRNTPGNISGVVAPEDLPVSVPIRPSSLARSFSDPEILAAVTGDGVETLADCDYIIPQDFDESFIVNDTLTGSMTVNFNLEITYSFEESGCCNFADVEIGQVVFNPNVDGDSDIDLVAGDNAVVVFDPIPTRANENDMIEFALLKNDIEIPGTRQPAIRAGDFVKQKIVFNPGSIEESYDLKIAAFGVNDSALNSQSAPISIQVRSLKPYGARLVRISPCSDGCSYGTVDPTNENNILAQSSFVEKVLPLTQGQFNFSSEGASLIGSPVPGRKGQVIDEKNLMNLKRIIFARDPSININSIVAVIDENYLTFHGERSEARGATGPNRNVVFLREDSGNTTLAHELHHSLGLDLGSDLSGIFGVYNGPSDLSGFDPVTGEVFGIDDLPSSGSGRGSIMGPDGCLECTWVQKEEYETALSTLLVTDKDPVIYVISGLLGADGALEADNPFILDFGTISNDPQGNFKVMVKDQDGLILSQTSEVPSFQWSITPRQGQGSSEGTIVDAGFFPFSIALPFNENAAEIEFELDGVTIGIVPAPALNSPPQLFGVDSLSGAQQGQEFSISYQQLFDASDVLDPEGDPISFRIDDVLNGRLLIDGTEVVSGESIISAGQSLSWLPAPDNSGNTEAFKVSAFDGKAFSENSTSVFIEVTNQVLSVQSIIDQVRSSPRRSFRFFPFFSKLIIIFKLKVTEFFLDRGENRKAKRSLKRAKRAVRFLMRGKDRKETIAQINQVLKQLE